VDKRTDGVGSDNTEDPPDQQNDGSTSPRG
jgi:hypothetical protein